MNLHKQPANWTIERVVDCRMYNISKQTNKTKSRKRREKTTTKHEYIHCALTNICVYKCVFTEFKVNRVFFRWMTTKRQSIPIYLGQIPGIESISYPLFLLFATQWCTISVCMRQSSAISGSSISIRMTYLV